MNYFPGRETAPRENNLSRYPGQDQSYCMMDINKLTGDFLESAIKVSNAIIL